MLPKRWKRWHSPGLATLHESLYEAIEVRWVSTAFFLAILIAVLLKVLW